VYRRQGADSAADSGWNVLLALGSRWRYSDCAMGSISEKASANSAASAAAPGRPAFIVVDWGTSSFRGWLIAADGTVLSESRGGEGMLHCAGVGFAPVLAEHRARLGASAELPVLICGMAGARQGWVEAPYLKTPTRLDRLHEGAIRIDTPGNVRILPGLAQAREEQPDVMRGEETQLLGAIEPGFTGLVCIPGTHSKWVRIVRGEVVEFATYMTGELFAVISQHSILVHAIEAGAAQTADDRAFQDGLTMAKSSPTGLTTSLFRLRAAQLLGFEQRTDGVARLSGLLIGSEIADALSRYGAQHGLLLIGAGALGDLYRSALTASGFDVRSVDAERASRRGLCKAANAIWGVPA
jgi:2-dehydro-3-deoxygalactonokinase